MIFAELPLADAEGAILAHSLTLGGRRIAKGSIIDKALIADAAAHGHERLWAARMEAGDVAEEAAATRIAAAMAGEGVEARAPVHGRVNLHATGAGILGAYAVDRANCASEAIGIATLPPATPVAAGDLVATVKVVPFALPAATLAAILESGPHLVVHRYRRGLAARLIATGDGSAKAKDKAARVTRDRLARLGVAMVDAPPLAHRVDALAAALAAATEPLLLVSGETATADRADVVPAAIARAGGTVLRVGMPVDPGNLLVLGTLGAATVIGLPGCAKSPKRNGLDLVLERWAAGLRIDGETIAGMGVGGLLEGSGRAVPWAWSR